ncbi:hypothetical protein [Motiliproteus coralliicola]|uniref:hypothetical protein n=1 Tax=Motiliproteus coralliicola TaxID=2283196 RepID=UPI001058AA62|nr:hypothetical protein [Motiliproteus coralliicola]
MKIIRRILAGIIIACLSSNVFSVPITIDQSGTIGINNVGGSISAGDAFHLSATFDSDLFSSPSSGSTTTTQSDLGLSISIGTLSWSSPSFRVLLRDDLFGLDVLSDAFSSHTFSGPLLNGRSIFRLIWQLEYPDNSLDDTVWPTSLSDLNYNEVSSESLLIFFSDNPADPFQGDVDVISSLVRENIDQGQFNDPVFRNLSSIPEAPSSILFLLGIIMLVVKHIDRKK